MANSESINSFMTEAVMLCKSMDCFLYNNVLRHGRVNETDMIDNEVPHETIENIVIEAINTTHSNKKRPDVNISIKNCITRILLPP